MTCLIKQNTMSIFILRISLIIFAGELRWGTLRITFKNTFVFFIGSAFLLVMVAIACIGFTVAQKGLIHLIWTVPFAIVMIIASYYFLAKKVKAPIQHSTKVVKKISNKDITANIDEKFKYEKYEIKDIVESVQQLITSTREFMYDLDISITELLNSISQINSSTSAICNSASKQSIGIEEISTSIEEMNIRAGQINASIQERTKSVQENAASSEELNATFGSLLDTALQIL